jgi:hypothetical protein
LTCPICAATHLGSRPIIAQNVAQVRRNECGVIAASPPRRRACVLDQSYDVGGRSYLARQSHIAASTPSRVQRASMAPGWHALQYA